MEADTAWSAPTNLTYATALLCPAAPAPPRLSLSLARPQVQRRDVWNLMLRVFSRVIQASIKSVTRLTSSARKDATG